MSDLGPILPLVTVFVRKKIAAQSVRQPTCYAVEIGKLSQEKQLLWH